MSKASDHAYEIIRGQIVTGGLAPGAQIKEEEIAKLCGVSRTPVRDALHRLEAEMFIRRTDSQRSFVSHWSKEDIEDVYMLRSILEAHAAVLAARRSSEVIRDALNANNAQMELAVRTEVPDVDAFLRLNSIFHSLVIEGAASERLGTMLNRLILLPLIERTARRYNRSHLERSLADHLEITTAIIYGDADWAGALMTAHVRRAFHVYAQDDTGGLEPAIN